MTDKFVEALKLAKGKGHDLVNDPPHALSSMGRYTCKLCGHAVLGNYTTAYGTALEVDCRVASLIRDVARVCVNCKKTAHIPAFEEKWTCYGCGRINRVEKKST